MSVVQQRKMTSRFRTGSFYTTTFLKEARDVDHTAQRGMREGDKFWMINKTTLISRQMKEFSAYYYIMLLLFLMFQNTIEKFGFSVACKIQIMKE